MPTYEIRVRVVVDRVLSAPEQSQLGEIAVDCEDRYAEAIQGMPDIARYAVETHGPTEAL